MPLLSCLTRTSLPRLATLAILTFGAACLSAAAFDLQGHRGARGLYPENTMHGFRQTLALGVHTLELDVVVTRDDVPVVSHDPALNPEITRDAQGRWLTTTGPAIRSLDLATLQTFDVGRIQPGSRTWRRYPTQAGVDREPIPTLDALVQWVKPHSAVRLNIETKLSPLAPHLAPDPEDFVRLVLDVLDRHDMRARASLQSFDWRTLDAARRLAPDLTRVALTARQRWLDNVGDPRWTNGLRLQDHGGSVPRLVQVAGANVWSPHFGDLDASSLAEARSLGLPVVVWTVNEPADIERMLELDVDGIISDYPDRVREAMARRGMALPLPP